MAPRPVDNPLSGLYFFPTKVLIHHGRHGKSMYMELHEFSYAINRTDISIQRQIVGMAFRRICRELGIKDLHFHDLRHEATSRFFEAGFDIPEVSLVTGQKDWKILRRYLNLRLRPHQLSARRLCLGR